MTEPWLRVRMRSHPVHTGTIIGMEADGRFCVDWGGTTSIYPADEIEPIDGSSPHRPTADVAVLAAFTGVRVEPIAVGSVVEARLHLARGTGEVGDERHRGRAAIYALAVAIEMAMRDVDFWSTTPYFHNDGAPVPDGYRGAVILDCGISARATALAMVRGIADQLQAAAA